MKTPKQQTQSIAAAPDKNMPLQQPESPGPATVNVAADKAEEKAGSNGTFITDERLATMLRDAEEAGYRRGLGDKAGIEATDEPRLWENPRRTEAELRQRVKFEDTFLTCMRRGVWD